MPIGRDDFLNAQQPLQERILTFLQTHPTNAFTLTEIIQGVEPGDRQALLLLLMLELQSGRRELHEKYSAAVSELLSTGQIEKAVAQGSDYFGLAVTK